MLEAFTGIFLEFPVDSCSREMGYESYFCGLVSEVSLCPLYLKVTSKYGKDCVRLFEENPNYFKLASVFTVQQNRALIVSLITTIPFFLPLNSRK